MNEIVLNYVVQAILGGASGYITNDYAINMLFKEYTPLKIGGVIKKTRHEFIENISSMVENDIINKERLQEILNDESFKEEFEKMTVDFFENSLYERTINDTFSNVDGFEKTMESTDVFVADIIKKHMPEVYEAIAENINFEDFFNKELLSNSASRLYALLEEIFNSTNIVENFILSLLKSNEKLLLKNIFSAEDTRGVVINAVNMLSQAISNCDDERIIDVLNSANFNNSVDSTLEILKNKNVKDVINLDSDVLYSFNESLLNYVNSEKGNILIEGLVNSLFSYGKECNKSIFQLLDSSFEDNLKKYLIKSIPSLTENVVTWIKLNSNLIDKLIEESIDEVIKNSDGLKAKLLSVIKNTYFSSLSKKYSIVDKIIAYVNRVAEPERLSENLSSKIIEILTNLTVKEIVLEAEKNHVTAESARKFILNYINVNSKSIIYKTASLISEIELRKIIPNGIVEKLKSQESTIIKKLAVSNFAKKSMINKSLEFLDNAMSKELGELIDNEKAACKIKEFIGQEVKANESSINAWITNKLESIKSYEELSSILINKLNDELLNYLNSADEKLKETSLSTAWDALNSIDNLASNSSEFIRTYAVRNSDVILSGSIKAIATENLNKLNDEELVDLANDFIGRELKPIMYFGGILGIFGGLMLAAFQNKPLNPSETNIASLFVYALVGFLTNVIAINMIFKPYKENKLLSKLPFFRNFSLGYIVKNQKTFAKNTAHFIDNSLLSKNSINELFEKYKDKIKLSFVKTIAENNKTLNKLAHENKKGAAKWFFSYLKEKLSSSSAGVYIYNKIRKINILSLIKENKFRSAILNKFISSDIRSYAHSFLLSDDSLESKFSGRSIKTFIISQTDSYLNKFETLLSNNEELSKIIINYEDKYENCIAKTVGEVTGKNKDIFIQSASEKLKEIVLPKKSREILTQKTVSFINKSIDKEKSFEEIFNGKLKNYIDSKIPDFLEKITSSAVKSIKESKLKISLMVQSEIKNNLGFLEKSMYSLMGGDEIIDELLAKIIVEKVPVFLESKKLEINSMANMLLQEKFYKAKVDVLYTGINKLQLNEVIDSYVDKNSMRIESKIEAMSKEMFTIAEDIKISSLLKLFYADDLNSFLLLRSEEITEFASNLKSGIADNKSCVMHNLSVLTDSLINDYIKHSFNDVFKGIEEKSIKETHARILDSLYENNIEDMINDALDELSQVSLYAEEIIHKDNFLGAVEKNVLRIMEDSKFEEKVKNFVEAVVDEAVLSNFGFLSTETKDCLINVFADSCISSLKRGLNEILQSIEFDKIAQKEIEEMEPKKIHEMFDSFAGKYFKRLMFYGFGGLVFGINMYVGFTLTTLKILSELLSKKLKSAD